MNVDKFGHHVHKRLRYVPYVQQKVLVESDIGEFDLNLKRLKGVRTPVSADEVVNKEYVDECLSQFYNKKEIDIILKKLQIEISKSVNNYLDKVKQISK